jgi:hypothetical protein
VTPADKPGSTGQDTERDADHQAGVATDGLDTPVDQEAGGKPEGNGRHEGNGKPSDDEPTARVATPDDLELSHSTPPPWQRVPSDTASPPAPPRGPATPPRGADVTVPTADGNTTPTTPPRGDGLATPPRGLSLGTPPRTEPPVIAPPGEQTVSLERPVVTGAAAARLFAEGLPTAATVPAPGTGMPHGGAAPSRTTVRLEGSGPSTGPLRMGAAATPSALRRPGRGPRRANLQIKRFDPWSVLKLSLVLGVALFFVWLVAVGVLYAVLDGMGVWDKLNGISSEILQPTDDGGGEPLISAGRVFGVAAIIGAVNIVLFSALSTVGAFIYNVSADLAGGLEVTLAERE